MEGEGEKQEPIASDTKPGPETNPEPFIPRVSKPKWGSPESAANARAHKGPYKPPPPPSTPDPGAIGIFNQSDTLIVPIKNGTAFVPLSVQKLAFINCLLEGDSTDVAAYKVGVNVAVTNGWFKGGKLRSFYNEQRIIAAGARVMTSAYLKSLCYGHLNKVWELRESDIAIIRMLLPCFDKRRSPMVEAKAPNDFAFRPKARRKLERGTSDEAMA